MRVLALLILLAGCSTMTLRAGTIVVGGKPAFLTTLEIGASFGSKRLYELTHEHGVQADGSGVTYVNAVGMDVVTLDDDVPVARIGPRLRACPSQGPADDASIGARAAFYPGLLHDPKTRSGGIGFELGGGMTLDSREPVIETAIVVTGKWNID
jgi:hypothetical protein